MSASDATITPVVRSVFLWQIRNESKGRKWCHMAQILRLPLCTYHAANVEGVRIDPMYGEAESSDIKLNLPEKN